MSKSNFHLVSFLFVVLLTLSAVSAQENQPQVPKQINGGVLNGKAVNLVKPEYPAAAKAVGAEGAVNVQITIDENGDVISASAVSGHPLLRATAVEAARQSKFSPTMLSGQPVKVTGVIVYNFTAAVIKANWFTVGSTLASLEKVPTLRYFNSDSIEKAIPAEWMTERQQLQRLNELKKAELESDSEQKPREQVIGQETLQSSSGSTTARTVTKFTLPPDKKISPEQVAIAQSLTASLRGRLAADYLNLWYFNAGSIVNNALGKANAKDGREDAINSFRSHLQNAPAEVPKEVSEELQSILSLLEKGALDDAERAQISGSMSKINMALSRLK